MKVKWNIFNRRVHYWGSAICAIPLLIVIVTGIILQFKKNADWVQPSSMRGLGKEPTITFEKVIDVAKTVDVAQVEDWKDIDRLDVRPKKGIIKIRTKSRWEIQIDHQTGYILKTAYRRSDLIESIHDGSFFHDKAKLWFFLPCAIILLVLWITGMYLFIKTLVAKNKKKKSKKAVANQNITKENLQAVA
jgi:uncharacterized iron-regulated membrane protein